LLDSININDINIYFLHIYANAPDYTPIPATDEGIACVDDAGRFMEVLEIEILEYGRYDLLLTARGITHFLLYMCRNDGLWYNFIDKEGQINRTHQNSKADFGWWAVRGLRGLAAAYNIFKDSERDSDLLEEVSAKIKTADIHLKNILKKYPLTQKTELGERPTWLIKNAPDLNSELLLTLTKLHSTGNFDYLKDIKKIAEGLVGYQYREEDSPLDGMYFCWNNVWHNWGNNQAYSLLKAFQITSDSALYKSVEIWANDFVPFLIENNFPWEIKISSVCIYDIVKLPQIAYGINSLYHGMKLLADLTGEEIYREHSETIFSWFTGNNFVKTPMYDPKTGRCYDGINKDLSPNLNSGAESTIECLLAIQRRGEI
jgi:hypothetical protein